LQSKKISRKGAKAKRTNRLNHEGHKEHEDKLFEKRGEAVREKIEAFVHRYFAVFSHLQAFVSFVPFVVHIRSLRLRAFA
jgi:3-methyladenine DNA glycosylase/8-oxoguanine DNA glycosylase